MNQTTATTPNPLGTEPIGKLLARYAVPSIISMVVMAVYNIVDQIFIGRDVGYYGNAATTVAFPLVTISMALALACGIGGAALSNLEMGRGNNGKVPNIVGTAMVATFGMGVALAVVISLFMKPLLGLMGATAEVMPHAIDYTTYIAMGMPFAMLGSTISHLIRSDGSPRFAMVCVLTGALLNVALDPIFIFTFGLHVKGAAMATAISQLVSAVIGVYYMARKTRNYTLTRTHLRPHPDLFRRMTAMGSSSFIAQISLTILNVVLNNSLTHYGAGSVYGAEIPLAAMGIVLKINAILVSCMLGIASGAQPILSYNYGAKQYERVTRCYKIEIAVGFSVAVIATLLFLTIPDKIIGVFGDANDQFNQFASMSLRIYLSGAICAGIQLPSANFFQAIGKPLKAMVLTICRQLLFLVSFILILPLFFGLMGILYAGPAADALALCVTTFFITREIRRISQLSKEAPVLTPIPAEHPAV